MPVPFSPDTGSSPDCCDVVLVSPRLVGFFNASMMLGWNRATVIGCGRRIRGSSGMVL